MYASKQLSLLSHVLTSMDLRDTYRDSTVIRYGFYCVYKVRKLMHGVHESYQLIHVSCCQCYLHIQSLLPKVLISLHLYGS